MASRRTLTVTSPAIPTSMGEPLLQATRLSGREDMNALYEYELLLKTPDAMNFSPSLAANFDLDTFVGQDITCSIALDGKGYLRSGVDGPSAFGMGAGTRQINGLITDATLWGEESQQVVYRLTIRPWLYLASLRTNCKIFQNKTPIEILDELLGAYTFPVRKVLYETYPKRDIQMQFNESDFAFFERICQEWGVSYHFEHSEGSHRLVLSDAMAAYAPNDSDAYRVIEYHPPGWKIDTEYISSFRPHSRLTSGRYSTDDFDYQHPKANLVSSRGDPRFTAHADAEVYEWHAPQNGSHFSQPDAGTSKDPDTKGEGNLLALLRMQALRTDGRRAQGSGNLRGLQCGHTFRMVAHANDKSNAEYLAIETRLLIEDAAFHSQSPTLAPRHLQQWRVEVEFGVHPTAEPLRPRCNRPKPSHAGVQTAKVVGPEGQSIWTDELSRIKVQFPWDRLGANDQTSSCWVRVSAPWAGNQLGGVHIPRIGQEVTIDFIGGDMDLPICTGRVYNALNRPPYKLPTQAALSGFRSRELTPGGGNSAAGRSNQLVMDDTQGQIQVQVRSDHQDSQLSLGYITRVEDNAGRKDARGQGFELRTDGHGVVRGADGMLITTEARMNAAGHAKDLGDAMARLTLARDLVEGQADAACTSAAQTKADQIAVAQALKLQNEGIQGKAGARGEGQFPELAAPHMVLATPSGMALTSGGSTHVASTEHLQFTSSKHTSLNSGGSLIAVALQAFKAYAMQNGMKMIAAQADIEIKALKNSIKLMAKDKIELNAREISIVATEKLNLNGGGTYAELKSGSFETGTSGTHIQHAATHAMVGSSNRPTQPLVGKVCGTKFKAASGGSSSMSRE